MATLRILKCGTRSLSQSGSHLVIAVDHGHDLGRSGDVRARAKFNAPALNPASGSTWKNRKRGAELSQWARHRLPDRRILGVVVDDQHLEVAGNPVWPGRSGSASASQAVRCRPARESRPSAVAPRQSRTGSKARRRSVTHERLRPFMGLGQQHQHDADHAQKHQHRPPPPWKSSGTAECSRRRSTPTPWPPQMR